MKSWKELIDRCLLFTEGHKGTLKSLLQEAEMEMVRTCDILEKTHETVFTGTDASITLPSDYKKPIAVWVDGCKLKPVSENEIYRNTDHTVNTGTPYGYFVKEDRMWFDKQPNNKDKIRIDYYATLTENASLQKLLPIKQFLRMDEELHSGYKYTQDNTGDTVVRWGTTGTKDTYDYVYYSIVPQLAWNPVATTSNGARHTNQLVGGTWKVLPNYHLELNSHGGISSCTMTNTTYADKFIKNPSTLKGLTGQFGTWYGTSVLNSVMHGSDYFITGPGSGAMLDFNTGSVQDPGQSLWTLPTSATITTGGNSYNRLRVALKSDAEGLKGLKVQFKRKYTTKKNINSTDSIGNVTIPEYPLHPWLTAELGDYEYDYENDCIIYDIATYNTTEHFNDEGPDTDSITENGWFAEEEAKATTVDISSNSTMRVNAFREYYPTIPGQYHTSLCDYAIAIINAKISPDMYGMYWGKWLETLGQVANEDADRDLPHSIREEV